MQKCKNDGFFAVWALPVQGGLTKNKTSMCGFYSGAWRFCLAWAGSRFGRFGKGDGMVNDVQDLLDL